MSNNIEPAPNQASAASKNPATPLAKHLDELTWAIDQLTEAGEQARILAAEAAVAPGISAALGDAGEDLQLAIEIGLDDITRHFRALCGAAARY